MRRRDGGVVLACELRLAPEAVEALAARLAELIAPALDSVPRQWITAQELARSWGVDRRWVYEHADELGARRLGSGLRPRLRFDPDEVAERLGRPAGAASGWSEAGSLSAQPRGNVGRQAESRPGRSRRGPRFGADRGRR